MYTCLLIVLLLYVDVVAGQAENCSFLITVPKNTRPGIDVDISVTIWRNLSDSINIAAVLKNRDMETVSGISQTIRGKIGKPIVVKLPVPANASSDYNYQIHIIGTGFLVFHKMIDYVTVSEKTSSLFIQTDKPIYKPGDLVQFRVFGMYPSLKVLNDPLDIIIYDPLGNRVQQNLNEKAYFGVFAGSLKLSTVTNLGDWKITVAQNKQNNYKLFAVEEYVLPKFEVTVSIPHVAYTSDNFVTIRVTALYTFGKPVQGDAYIKISRYSSDMFGLFETNVAINGKVDIKVPTWELYPQFGKNFHVFARINESLTGKAANDSSQIQLYEKRHRVDFSQNMPTTFKPGLKYTVIFRLLLADESPITPPAGSVKVIITYDYTHKVDNTTSLTRTKVLFKKRINIPANGIVTQQVTFPHEANSGKIYVVYKDEEDSSLYLSKATSPSNNFIQVRVPGDTPVTPRRFLTLEIATTERIRLCYFQIFSKGMLLQQGIFQMRMGTFERQRIYVTFEMTPKAKLLVYYIRQDGEIVADAITFAVGDVFQNKVTMKFNKNTAEPAEKVDLYLTADPGSMVNVLAIDKSVMLLKTGNDITVADVVRELQKYDYTYSSFNNWESLMTIPDGGTDSKAVFAHSGVYVHTDCEAVKHLPDVSFKRPLPRSMSREVVDVGFREGGGGAGGPQGPQGPRGDLGPSPSPPGPPLVSPTRTRSRFPETWLWLNTTVSKHGTATLSTTVPDTITQWITSAFAVSPYTGLGIAAELTNITTFQKFFMRFELPYSVIRGEVLVLQISVFNYVKDLDVHVSIESNVNITFVDMNGHPFILTSDEWTKIVHVPKDTVKAVYFPLIPNKIGTTLLRAKIRSTLAADAEERMLLVKPEGIKQSYNIPVLVDLRQQSTFSTERKITFPPNVIQDSEFVKISVIGDVIGTALNGIEDLLQMSYGCGEQNLVKFVPNVFIASYLNTTNRLTDAIKEKVDRYLKAGYQRQLFYAHYDGSFSAFGRSDQQGSTWLTAFVLKSFAQAAKYTFIDPYVMRKAIHFLFRQQIDSGQFVEHGIVHSKGMQGGSASGDVSLTSYVVIALQEAKIHKQISDDMLTIADSNILRATNYVARTIQSSIANLYQLAIATYAMTLVGHSSATTTLLTIEQLAINTESGKFWRLNETIANIIQPFRSWSPPRMEVAAIDIEITSYILLVYNLKKDIFNGLNVLKWLNEQRNPYGGFISTQDTVVALQAITGLAEHIYAPTLDASVTVTGDTWSGHTFKVDNTNSLVLQSVDVPHNSTRRWTIDSTGRGVVFVEAAVFFYVPEELRQPVFDLSILLFDESVFGFRLRICFRWLGRGNSTMGYLQIAKLTGMEADMESLQTAETNGLYKTAEKFLDQIHIYFDWITSTQMCLELNMERVSLVARQKPVPVRLSEYYEQGNEVIKMYQSQLLSSASVADVCGNNQCQ